MQRLAYSCSILVLAFSAAACNTSERGANGNVLFTPHDCGRVGCDFDDSIGVGGSIEVSIRGTEGVSTAGVNLESGDPELLAVEPAPDQAGRPRWRLTSLAPGVARLFAVDADGYDLDFLEVPMQELTGLALDNVLGDAVGPSGPYETYDEIWTINAGEPVSFDVTPMIGNGVPTMGRYQYAVTLDPEIEAGLIERDPTGGYLYFEVPPGDYEAIFTDDWGHQVRVLFESR